MEKLELKTTINAPREKVWDILWGNKTYQEWTSPFAEGSRAETDWKEGSKVLFLDGKGSGMVSMIETSRPNEFMSFKHLGEIKDGVEDTDSEKVKEWSGSHENYTLKAVDGKTELTVEMDVNEQWKDFMKDTWPKALDKLKALAEGN